MTLFKWLKMGGAAYGRMVKQVQGIGYCLVLVYIGTWGVVWASDGVALFQAGQFEKARAVFEAAFKENPNDPVAMYYLGRLTPEGATSQAFFQRIRNKFPHHDLADDALFELAEVDYANGLYLTARKKYRHLLAHYPKTNQVGMAHYRIGLTFLAIQQADSALVAFDATQVFPDMDARFHARLGRLEALLQKKKKSEALREAKEWLGEGAGNFEKDVRDFVARIAPDDVDAKWVPVETETGKYWVQVGAYSNFGGARGVKERLEKVHFRVVLGHKPNSKLTFVFVGPYQQESEAERDAKRIDHLLNIQSKVTER